MVSVITVLAVGRSDNNASTTRKKENIHLGSDTTGERKSAKWPLFVLDFLASEEIEEHFANAQTILRYDLIWVALWIVFGGVEGKK